MRFGADRIWETAVSLDPFLRAHEVGLRILEIGPRLSPLSIRDQMFRAAVAVDRAVEHSLIGKDRPLLIVGGGAAGAAGAARALRYDVPTVLVEAHPYLFYRQDRCATRWVSPTQYDWPAPHADKDSYPWEKVSRPNVELPWSSGSGEDLATQWNLALQAAQVRCGGRLRVLTKLQILAGCCSANDCWGAP